MGAGEMVVSWQLEEWNPNLELGIKFTIHTNPGIFWPIQVLS